MTGKQRRHLRALAHALRPIVQVGQRGLTDAVVQQVDAALDDHELIKVKLAGDCRDTGIAREIASRTGAELTGRVGHVVILYRRHPEEPRIRLPAAGQQGEEAPHDPL